jgi:hypothetical protein
MDHFFLPSSLSIASFSSARPDSITALAKDGSFGLGVFASACQPLASGSRQKRIRIEQLPETRNRQIFSPTTRDNLQKRFSVLKKRLNLSKSLQERMDSIYRSPKPKTGQTATHHPNFIIHFNPGQQIQSSHQVIFRDFPFFCFAVSSNSS